jgi:transposase
MVLEHPDDYDSQWKAIESISEKFGMSAETPRKWVRRVKIDGGRRQGVTSVEAQRVKDLERENRELPGRGHDRL